MTVCGTGGWSGPQPGDPDNNVTLTAQFTFGGINVRWTYPGLNPQAVSYTIVYRNTVADMNTAYQHAIVGGNYLFDPIETAVAIEYFYWIRIMSVNGTLGDPIGPASAIAGPTVAAIIDMLSGQIDQSMLAGYLSTQIAQIELNRLGITQEMLDRDAADDSLGVALTLIEAHSDETRALLQEEVLARTTNDSAIVQSVNTLWAEAGGAVAAIQVEATARADADSALASQITTTQTTLNGNIASVQQTLESQIDVVDGEVTNIGARWTAVVDVNGLVGGFGIYNNGTVVDAGFNVDNFWIGKVGVGGAPGVYPFIVTGGKVYMKSAMISQLTADQIDTRGLTIKDAAGNIIFASGTALDFSRIGGSTKPANNATIGAPSGTYVAGQLAQNVASAVTNFNAANDRNTSTVEAPTIPVGGAAIDHVLLGNGTADISFEWIWAGDEATIDGFLIYVYSSAASSAYTFGGLPAQETVYMVPANKRAFFLLGVMPTYYYTFGVRAYRRVDSDLGGIIQSAIVKSTVAGENPYRPDANLAFAGNLTGSVMGDAASSVLRPGNPVTSANISTYIQSLAVNTLQLGNNVVSLPKFAESGQVTLAAGYTQLCYIDVLIPATGNTAVDNDIPVMIQWHAECNAQNDGADPRQFKISKVAFTVEATVHETFSGGRDIDEYSGGVYRTTILAGYNVQFRLYAKGSGILYHSGISVTVLRR